MKHIRFQYQNIKFFLQKLWTLVSDKDDLIKILNQLIGKAGNQNEW